MMQFNPEKPGILVYLFTFFPYEDANTNVMMPILNALAEKYTVEIYTVDPVGDCPAQETLKGFQVWRNAYVYHKETKTKKDFFYALKSLLYQIYHTDPDTVCSPFADMSYIPDAGFGHFRWILYHIYHTKLSSILAPFEDMSHVPDTKRVQWFLYHVFQTDPANVVSDVPKSVSFLQRIAGAFSVGVKKLCIHSVRGYAYFVRACKRSVVHLLHGYSRFVMWLKRAVIKSFRFLVPVTVLNRLLFGATVSYADLEGLMMHRDYSALITVTAPIITQYNGVALAKKGAFKSRNMKWFAYFTDPHATFIGHENHADQSTMMRQECEIYKKADAVFTTPELYEDNQRYPLGKYRNKTIPIQIASLKAPENTVKTDYLNHNQINCVYTGSLFSLAVRNPEYFFKLVQQCTQENIAIHIVCYQIDEKTDDLREKYLSQNKNVYWHQKASLAECHSLMCEADILINIGNLCSNQTPSKVFDYIGAGKPIVNFYAIAQDTSKKYLERYPLKLNLLDKPQLDAADVAAFIDFCTASAGKSLPFSEVEALYPDCLAENVAADFLQKFEICMQA